MMMGLLSVWFYKQFQLWMSEKFCFWIPRLFLDLTYAPDETPNSIFKSKLYEFMFL